jgi:hypothetical protein
MFLLFQAHEGALDGPPQGFAAKRAFSINLRKGFQVGLRVFVQPLNKAAQCLTISPFSSSMYQARPVYCCCAFNKEQ